MSAGCTPTACAPPSSRPYHPIRRFPPSAPCSSAGAVNGVRLITSMPIVLSGFWCSGSTTVYMSTVQCGLATTRNCICKMKALVRRIIEQKQVNRRCTFADLPILPVHFIWCQPITSGVPPVVSRRDRRFIEDLDPVLPVPFFLSGARRCSSGAPRLGRRPTRSSGVAVTPVLRRCLTCHAPVNVRSNTVPENPPVSYSTVKVGHRQLITT